MSGMGRKLPFRGWQQWVESGEWDTLPTLLAALIQDLAGPILLL